jgi:hypothetical protein
MAYGLERIRLKTLDFAAKSPLLAFFAREFSSRSFLERGLIFSIDCRLDRIIISSFLLWKKAYSKRVLDFKTLNMDRVTSAY